MSQTASGSRRALVVVQANIEIDPRVIRQIDWLTSAGWTVDSLGLGKHPSPNVSTHYEMKPITKWTKKNRVKLALIHAFLPYRKRFQVLRQSHFPAAVSEAVQSGAYDLIILNDTHLLGWLSDTSVFPVDRKVAHIHVDLHEWFPAEIVNGTTRGKFLMQGYHRWLRNHIAHPAVDTRSLAVDNAEAYLRDFDIPRPLVVRNAPPFVAQKPTPVDDAHIRLLHHGLAAWKRGFRELIDAMRLVDDRFSLTLMLVGPDQTINEIKNYASDLGDKVRFDPPAPMTTLAQSINPFDVEVMFFPPVTENLKYALPNKFFEAIQGRLAMVIGPSKSMAEIVDEAGCGVVTAGWTAEDLAQSINELTGDSVRFMKTRTDSIASDLCAEGERHRFFESIGFPETS